VKWKSMRGAYGLSLSAADEECHQRTDAAQEPHEHGNKADDEAQPLSVRTWAMGCGIQQQCKCECTTEPYPLILMAPEAGEEPRELRAFRWLSSATRPSMMAFSTASFDCCTTPPLASRRTSTSSISTEDGQK
jgi:hypothetical protein